MADVRHIRSRDQQWIWIEALDSAAVIVDSRRREIVAGNSKAQALIGETFTTASTLPSSAIIPEYLLPSRELVSNWVVDTLNGESAGIAVDILVEPEASGPVRMVAHMSPADSTGSHLLVRLDDSTGTDSRRAETADDVLMRLMGDIGRIVGSTLNLEAVCKRFAISLMQVVPAERVAILLREGEGDSVVTAYSTADFPLSGQITIGEADPITRAMKIQSTVILGAGEIAALRNAGQTIWSNTGEILSAGCVPLVANGQCVGLALVGSVTANAFTGEDIEIVENASSQVAGAISNLMLHDRLAANALEREVLADIGRLAGAAFDLAGAMPGIAAQIERFMPVSDVFVHEMDELSGEPREAFSWSRFDWSPNPDDWQALESNMKRVVDGAATTTTILSHRDDQAIASSVTAALRFGGRPIGTLTIVSAPGTTYGPAEESFTSLVANQIAGPVHTARVYRDQQREGELRKSLSRISLAASEDLASSGVFERIANEVAELIQYDLFTIALIKPDHSGLSVRFKIGTDEVEDVYNRFEAEPGSDSPAWHEHLVPSTSKDPRFAVLSENGISSVIEVSLGNRDSGATGYVLVGSESSFSPGALKILVQIAEQVTPAIQNATAHEQAVELAESRMAEAKAAERNLELERINDAKSQFLSVVSHELRTPLTSIIAYAEILQRNTSGNLNEKQIKQAQVINKSASHLKFLISDLLDVSRIESGNLSLEISNFEIADVMKDIVNQFEPVLAEKKQHMDAYIPSESIYLRADRSRIVQIISNLVENASKYSDEETTLTVTVHRSGGEVVISVADQGIGISEEDQAQLFVPFFRADSALTRTAPGTGLGLALVKSISELHGGAVSVKSEPGKGSTFTVTLKTAPAEQVA